MTAFEDLATRSALAVDAYVLLYELDPSPDAPQLLERWARSSSSSERHGASEEEAELQ